MEGACRPMVLGRLAVCIPLVLVRHAAVAGEISWWSTVGALCGPSINSTLALHASRCRKISLDVAWHRRSIRPRMRGATKKGIEKQSTQCVTRSTHIDRIKNDRDASVRQNTGVVTGPQQVRLDSPLRDRESWGPSSHADEIECWMYRV